MKIGKNCELEKKVCEGNLCNGFKICVLFECVFYGYKCVDKELEMVMVLFVG